MTVSDLYAAFLMSVFLLWGVAIGFFLRLLWLLGRVTPRRAGEGGRRWRRRDEAVRSGMARAGAGLMPSARIEAINRVAPDEVTRLRAIMLLAIEELRYACGADCVCSDTAWRATLARGWLQEGLGLPIEGGRPTSGTTV